MCRYTITEVAEMIGVKAHVIRYWEEQSGLFSAQRDKSGKRLYEWKDILLLNQFQYLRDKKKYGIKNATTILIHLLQDRSYTEKRSMFFSILKNMDLQRNLLNKAQHILVDLKTLQEQNKS